MILLIGAGFAGDKRGVLCGGLIEAAWVRANQNHIAPRPRSSSRTSTDQQDLSYPFTVMSIRHRCG
jgi:hypothetical protein